MLNPLNHPRGPLAGYLITNGHDTFWYVSVEGKIMGPKNVNILIPKLVNMTPRLAKGTLQMDVIKVKDFEVGRLAWVTQVGPIQSLESLKGSKFFQL